MRKSRQFIILAISAVVVGIIISLWYYNVAAAQDYNGGYKTVCTYYFDENTGEYSPINWGFFTIGDYDSDTDVFDNTLSYVLLGTNCITQWVNYSPFITGMIKDGCGSDDIQYIEVTEDMETLYFIWDACKYMYIPLGFGQ